MKSTRRSPGPIGDASLVVHRVGQDTQHRTARIQPFDAPGRPNEHGQVVPGVRVRHRPEGRVQHAVAEADEPSLGDVAAQDAVHLLAEVRRFDGFRGECPHGRLKIRHQERRRDPLADDVGDRDGEPRLAERQRVEAVASDACRRLPRGGDVPAFDRRQALRKQLPLDLPRLGDFTLLVRTAAPPRAAVRRFRG